MPVPFTPTDTEPPLEWITGVYYASGPTTRRRGEYVNTGEPTKCPDAYRLGMGLILLNL